METTILLDCNNLCHRVGHVAKSYMKINGKQVVRDGVVVGMLRDLLTLGAIHNSRRFIFCFDGNDILRKKLYPLYKADHIRNDDNSGIYKGMDVLAEGVLPLLGFENVFRLPAWEADDLIAYFCLRKDSKGKSGKYVIVSTDTDLYQLLRHDVHIWNPIQKMEISPEWLWLNHRLKADEWATAKAIIGGKDNIQGIRGAGPKTAASYIRGELQPYAQSKIAKSWDIVRGNMPLVLLPCPELPDPDLSLKPDDKWSQEAWNLTVVEYGNPKLIGRKAR